MNLNKLAQEVHESNSKWWTDLNTGERIERNKQELCMLIVTELAEAMEGERKNLQDDKLPHRKMVEVEMADVVIRALDYAGGFKIKLHDLPEGKLGDELFEDAAAELPDNKGHALLSLVYGTTTIPNAKGDFLSDSLTALIYGCHAYCLKHGYDLWGAYTEKMEYNKTRHDHTIEARKAANGKKF